MDLPRRLILLLAALGVVGVAGCGGGSTRASGTSATTVSPTTATTATTTSSPAARQDPRRTLRAARKALVGLRSYHLEGSQTDPSGTTALSADVTASGDLTMTLRQHGTSARVTIVGHQFYLRGDSRFWRRNRLPQRVADAIAGRWVKAPSTHDITRLSDDVRPSTLAHCLSTNIGHVTDRGLTTFHGQRVRVIEAAGDAPGSSPGRMLVTATGPTLPVRVLQTGPVRPGGRLDPRCTDPSQPDRSTRSDIVLSRFDRPLHVTAPAGALDLEALASQLSGATPS